MKLCCVGGLFLSFFVQAQPVVAQRPQAENAGLRNTFVAWDQELSVISREGYASLTWKPVDGAVSYSVRDQRDVEVYQGPFAQAFASGLPNGKHTFDVVAFDVSGLPIASTSESVTIDVKHWPLMQALLLFGMGLLVSLAMAIVLVLSAVVTKREQGSSTAEVSN